MKKLSPNAVGLAVAILSAFCMLVIGVLALLEMRMEAFAMMKTMHIWFDATVVGVLLGMLEAFVFAYVGGALFALLYNKLA